MDEPYWLGFLTAAANLLWDIDSLRAFGLEQVARTREEGALTMLPVALNNARARPRPRR